MKNRLPPSLAHCPSVLCPPLNIFEVRKVFSVGSLDSFSVLLQLAKCQSTGRVHRIVDTSVLGGPIFPVVWPFRVAVYFFRDATEQLTVCLAGRES